MDSVGCVCVCVSMSLCINLKKNEKTLLPDINTTKNLATTKTFFPFIFDIYAISQEKVIFS